MHLAALAASGLVTQAAALGNACRIPIRYPNGTFNKTTVSTLNSTSIAALPQPTNITVNVTGPGCRGHTVLPSDIRAMKSNYPSQDSGPRIWFEVSRDTGDSNIVASQVQFHGLPQTRNKTCELQFLLPTEDTSDMWGPSPSFDVYQVAREAASPATWDTFALAEHLSGSNASTKAAKYMGTINNDPEALNQTQANDGTVVVNTMKCNETLTFQMLMKRPRPGTSALTNYFTFAQMPNGTQGWRVVYPVSGC